MISITKLEGEDTKVLFQPWSNVSIKEIDHELVQVYNKIQVPQIENKLLFGHVCPICNNVLQAAFLTCKEVDTRPYEEVRTTFKDEKGSYRTLRTGTNSRFKSKYDSIIVNRGNKVSAQLIKLTEHFERSVEDTTPICNFRAFFSFRPDMAVQYMILNSSLNPSKYDLNEKNIQEIRDIIASQQYMKDDYRDISDEAGGDSKIWLVRTGAYNWTLDHVLKEYMRK